MREHTVMEVRDGFIVGVYNYCDGWCDRCAFTLHCELFADKFELEAAHGTNEVARPQRLQASGRRVLRLVPERDAINRRSDEYLRRTRTWLQQRGREDGPDDHGDPRAVISWFHLMIHVKAMRALSGLEGDDPSDRDWPPDHDGSAKVALIGIDRSYTAWLDLVEVGALSAADAMPFLDDLLWLRGALERTFPEARSFVRPAFDEPDDVARLLRPADL